ncbi:MAG TPA: hypothetical protein VF037_10510 [Gemmatimonadales bacterium]
MRRAAGAALAALAIGAGPLSAQAGGITPGVSALVLYDRVDPIPGGGALGELRVVHPVVMLHGRWAQGRLRFTGMGNFEGLTIEDGQLAPGVAGEGYADRRHPHTYLHEAVLTFQESVRVGSRDLAVSVSAGKGFAPFGSDDPMSRPVIRYPVNHHIAQVLERLVGIVAARSGPVGVEAGLFNGDEPDGPGQWPNAGRFGDSWALRVTVAPVEGLEVQGSLARIASPEHRPGGGLDHRQRNLSARVERPLGAGSLYVLAEFARSDDDVEPLHTFLAEGAWRRRAFQAHYRFERTERPEEQRLADPWRTPRPHHDFSNSGYTRWSIHTLGVSADLAGPGSLHFTPVLEGSLGRIRSLLAGAFDPAEFYGRDTFWMLSAGVRVGWGARLHRMGRYGAAELPPAAGGGATHVH